MFHSRAPCSRSPRPRRSRRRSRATRNRRGLPARLSKSSRLSKGSKTRGAWRGCRTATCSSRNAAARCVSCAAASCCPIRSPACPKVRAQGQGGLLEVAVHPNFAQNHFIYLSYAKPNEDGKQGTTALTRAKFENDKLVDAEGDLRSEGVERGAGPFRREDRVRQPEPPLHVGRRQDGGSVSAASRRRDGSGSHGPPRAEFRRPTRARSCA